MATFDHALSEAFIENLRREAGREGWWRDVLDDPTLVIATRGGSLNVYWRGQSLFRASLASGALAVTTHEKFVLNPDLKGQVRLRADGTFDVAALREKGFLGCFKAKQTLPRMKSAAEVYADAEKSGCHEIAIRNPSVIDVEVAFPGNYVFGNKETRAPRVDLVAVEADGSDGRLVFWEAKTYGNRELRALAMEAPAKVCGQVERYKQILIQHRDAVETSYARVAENLVALKEMGWARALSSTIEAVGKGEAALRLHEEPAVGLVVFGFDVGQREGKDWKGHRGKLEERIARVKCVGDAKQVRL